MGGGGGGGGGGKRYVTVMNTVTLPTRVVCQWRAGRTVGRSILFAVNVGSMANWRGD